MFYFCTLFIFLTLVKTIVSNSMSKIAKVLSDDRSARKPSSKRVLHKLSEIIVKDWDYSLPTIPSPSQGYRPVLRNAATQNSNSAGMSASVAQNVVQNLAGSSVTQRLKNNMITNITTFKTLFNKNYSSYLGQIDYNNLLIAGGCISDILVQGNWGGDVDMFIYGLDEKKATEKVSDLLTQIYQSFMDFYYEEYKKEHPEEEDTESKIDEITVNAQRCIITLRNKNCITVRFDYKREMEIQIILRLYKDIGEILYGFDLGSSAVGYDGKDVFFSGLGKYSYEYFANIVDPSRRSTTYELRLMKYFNRGFQIILPDLDIKKMRTDNFKYKEYEIINLPYLPFAYTEIKGNKITLLRTLTDYSKRESKCTQKTDYESFGEEMSEYNIFYLNLKNLVKGGDNYYYYSTKMDPDNIINASPYISKSRIIDYYDKLGEKIYSECTFSVKAFMFYFSEEVLPRILQSLMIDKDFTEFNKLIEEQKQIILEKSDESDNHSELPWKTVEPGSQISGSFNPIVSDPKDWYGKYYIDRTSNDEEYKSKPIKSARSTTRR